MNYSNEENNPEDPYIASNLIVNHFNFLQNKKILLCYIQERLSRLRELRWQQAKLPDNIRENCSDHELEYFDNFSFALQDYMKKTKVDITSDLTPPKDTFIEIMIKKDLGKVTLETGVLFLEKNSVVYLKRSDAESLVRNGSAEYIK